MNEPRTWNPQHVSVSSSNIESVAYNDVSRTLQVKMRHGKTFEYANVPAEVHTGLMAARSIGGYHHEKVKGKFETKEVV
jgi:hypothetical protein